MYGGGRAEVPSASANRGARGDPVPTPQGGAALLDGVDGMDGIGRIDEMDEMDGKCI